MLISAVASGSVLGWLAAWVRASARPSLQHRGDSVSTALLSQPKYIEEFVKKSSGKKGSFFVEATAKIRNQ